MYKTVFILTGMLLLVHCKAINGAGYDVYLLAGQSNMDGRGAVEELTEEQRQPFESVIIYYRNIVQDSAGWHPLAPGFSHPPKFKKRLPSHTFGPELGFAFEMVKAEPNRRLALIKASKGGTSLRKDWQPGLKDQPETQGTCYQNFVETIQLATDKLTRVGHTFELRGLLWHQGEADSKSRPQVYEARFREFVARIQEDIGVNDLPVVVGEVFDNGKRDKVRAALRAIGTSGSQFGLVSAEETSTVGDGSHFDAASQLLLGQRYAEAIMRIEDSL